MLQYAVDQLRCDFNEVDPADIQEMLNERAALGWRLAAMVAAPSSNRNGDPIIYTLTFERTV
jgi:hypothetical protein